MKPNYHIYLISNHILLNHINMKTLCSLGYHSNLWPWVHFSVDDTDLSTLCFMDHYDYLHARVCDILNSHNTTGNKGIKNIVLVCNMSLLLLEELELNNDLTMHTFNKINNFPANNNTIIKYIRYLKMNLVLTVFLLEIISCLICTGCPRCI